MAEFPRDELTLIADVLDHKAKQAGAPSLLADAIRKAITVHEQLQDRCVRDRTELSLQIANLRARLREVDPEWKL